VIVDCAHYRDGRRQQEGPIDLARAADLARREDDTGFVWIGLMEPTAAVLEEIQELFELSELAVEDAQSFHLRPKIEYYDEANVLFSVLRSGRYDDQHEEIEFGEVSIFLAPRFVISVRQGGPWSWKLPAAGWNAALTCSATAPVR
jgi:magnesium transporter